MNNDSFNSRVSAGSNLESQSRGGPKNHGIWALTSNCTRNKRIFLDPARNAAIHLHRGACPHPGRRCWTIATEHEDRMFSVAQVIDEELTCALAAGELGGSLHMENLQSVPNRCKYSSAIDSIENLAGTDARARFARFHQGLGYDRKLKIASASATASPKGNSSPKSVTRRAEDFSACSNVRCDYRNSRSKCLYQSNAQAFIRQHRKHKRIPFA